MAGVEMIEPTELYNILNQALFYSNLSNPNYLVLFDARNKEAYNESHVITAKRIKMDDKEAPIPYDTELECKEYVIVYDGNTEHAHLATPAAYAATFLSDKGSRNSVKIVSGGYERFSALYPFLRTQKILFMPRELDDYQAYPIEIIPGFLYVGTEKQAFTPYIQKDLKLKAHVNCTTDDDLFYTTLGPDLCMVGVRDSNDACLDAYIEEACQFLDTNQEKNRNVLIYSKRGISRCISLAIAYLIYSRKYTLSEAWKHVANCYRYLRPNRGFVEHLSAFEEKILGEKMTDISDPNY